MGASLRCAREIHFHERFSGCKHVLSVWTSYEEGATRGALSDSTSPTAPFWCCDLMAACPMPWCGGISRPCSLADSPSESSTESKKRKADVKMHMWKVLHTTTAKAHPHHPHELIWLSGTSLPPGSVQQCGMSRHNSIPVPSTFPPARALRPTASRARAGPDLCQNQ